MPGGYKNIKPTDGVKFGEGQSRAGNGRKPKILTVIKDLGYGITDIKTAFGVLPFYDEKKLKEVEKDEKKPMLLRIIAKQLYIAYKNGDYNKVKEIIEHTIGKPEQTTRELGNAGGTINVAVYSDEAKKTAEKLIDKFEKE